MTNKEMMNIRYETCDLWNSLKDKSKIIDTVIDLKEQNLELKSELEELKKNSIVPKFRVGQEVFYLGTNKVFTGIVTKTKITNSKKIQYSIRSNDNQLHTKNETDVFATEQEARKELEEFNNGKA